MVPISSSAVSVGDVELCVDTVGSPTEPALLLIGTTVAAWDDELVERLTGRFVIRYDLRDAGRSTTVDPDSPGYTLRDLVTDAVGVLDGLGIARAHVVGLATGRVPISTSEATRDGWSSARSCAMKPLVARPTTCARAMPSPSSTPTASVTRSRRV